MLNWFLGLAGIIMGVAIGQAVTNGTEGQRDTGRRFVIESFFSGSVPPAAISCYVSNGDMKYCMGADEEALDRQNITASGRVLARRSNNKNGLVAYGLGMRASNDERLWLRDTSANTTEVSDGEINTRNANARSAWSMVGGGKRFFISYNIEENWFSDNETVGKLMAAKIARSSANIIGVAFSIGVADQTVYWEYGSNDSKKLSVAKEWRSSGSATTDLFYGLSSTTGSARDDWKQIASGRGTPGSPMITVFYEL